MEAMSQGHERPTYALVSLERASVGVREIYVGFGIVVSKRRKYGASAFASCGTPLFLC